MTLRAYVSVLKLEDNIRGHKAFVKACVQAAELYLLLHKADSAEVANCVEIDQCVGCSLSHFSAMTRPCRLRRAVTNRHRHAIEQASRRWRGGRRTRRKI